MIAYYARKIFEARSFFFVKATWRDAMNPLRKYRGRCQSNVTSCHIDRLAASKCCAVHVLTSRISLTWPWRIRQRSSIICWNPSFFVSHCRHISLWRPGSCTIARSSLRKKHVGSSPNIVIFPYAAPAVAQELEVVFGKIHVRSSLTIVIFPYVTTVFAQVLEVAFGKFHFCSSLTIVIFPYVAPVVAKVLEVAFGNIHVCLCLTFVIFSYVVPVVAQVLEVAFKKIHVFRVSLYLYFLV